MIIGSKKIYFAEVDSTNSLLSRLARVEKLNEGTLIRSDFQTAGRGQKDNHWESQVGKNMTFSFLLYPDFLEPSQQFLLSMAISLGISDYLSRYTENCRIKWPNDIYVGNDKIAGILIENSIESNTITRSIAGIGLNVNQTDFTKAPNPVSLKIITGRDHDTDKELDILLPCLDRRYKQLISAGFLLIRHDYTMQLFRLNEWCEYSTADGKFTGCIRSAATDGKLQVEGKDGLINEFSFREIEFIL